MTRFQKVEVCLIAASLFCVTVSAQAATLTSAPFSIGYGMVRTGSGVGTWQTSETSAANTPLVQGDFSFTPTVTGTMLSNAGPTFSGRVFADGDNVSGTGGAIAFGLSLTGAYSGTLPPTAFDTVTRVNVTEVRIRGTAHPAFSGTDLAWHESTAGNTQTGPTTTLSSVPNSGAFATTSYYSQLSWDPADIFVSGLTDTRVFDLLSSGNRGIDGLEIFGTVDVTYSLPAPEPGTGLLLGLGLVFFTRRVSCRRKA